MNILAIGSHPDDIEYGCGGTLLKYAQKGHHVYLFIATQGQAGGNSDIRYQEQLHSIEILGAKEVFWGGCGYPDSVKPGTDYQAGGGHPTDKAQLYFCTFS